MLLESGPALKDRAFNAVFALVLIAYAGWCYYDGAHGYVSKNREEARKKLTPIVGEGKVPDTLGDSITRDTAKRVQEAKPDTPAKVHDILGKPFHTKLGAAGEVQAEYFVSDYGMITVPVTRDTVVPKDIQFEKWYKDRDEIQMQFGMMALVLAVGAYFGFRAIKASLLRVTIDENALVYAGRRIPVPSMKRLTDYSRKGWVDLYYQDAAGREQKLRFDDQKVLKFHEIIDVLCKLRGFPDPREAVLEEPAEGDPDSTQDERSRSA